MGYRGEDKTMGKQYIEINKLKDDLIKAGKEHKLEDVIDYLAIRVVDSQSIAEVKEIKQGKWLDIKESNLEGNEYGICLRVTAQTCSVCSHRTAFIGSKEYLHDNLCPNCGAEMSNF